MNAKQKIHQANLARWAGLIRDQKESGLSIDKWCKREGIPRHSYFYWKNQLKEEALESVDLPDIVPLLPPQEGSSSTPSALPTPSSYKLYNSCNSYNSIPTAISMTIGDIRIEIGANAPDNIIANIIKAVRHA